MRKIMAMTLLATLLSACGGTQDYSQAYQAREVAYRAKHPYTEHAIVRDGHTLYAREFTPPSGSSSTPLIILMHGFPDSLHLYDRLAPLLATQRRVVSFDFLGWGRSDKPTDHRYDVASLRRDLDRVIAHFDARQVVLVVHDSSGQPGIDFALDHPDRVAELVLLNTYYGPSDKLIPPPAIARFSTPGLARDLLVFGASHSDARWQNGYRDQIQQFFENAEVRADYLDLFAHQSLSIRPAFFSLNRVLRQEVAARASRIAALRQLPVPSKIIFGAEDPFLNAEVAREFHDILPQSQLHLVVGGAHYVQLDKPEDVAALILAEPAS